MAPQCADCRKSGYLPPRLLEAWRVEGSEETEFGLVNAITRVATHDETLTSRERRLLARARGTPGFLAPNTFVRAVFPFCTKHSTQRKVTHCSMCSQSSRSGSASKSHRRWSRSRRNP